MKLHAFGLLVFLSAAAALAAQPETGSNKEPAKKSIAVPGSDDDQRLLLLRLQSIRSGPGDQWEREWGEGPVVLRGKLVRTGDGSTFFTKERKRRQTGGWILEARLGSDIVWVPLVRVAADEKLLDAAEELAGKEVVLTGKTVIATAYLQLVESKKYPAVSVTSLKVAEPPQPEKKGAEPKQAAESEPTRPKDWDSMSTLNIYFAKEKVYTLGNATKDWKTLYRWKGVVVDEKDMPKPGPFVQSAPIDDDRFPKIIAVDPPVTYSFDKMKIGRVGYLDRDHSTFYQWKGIALTKCLCEKSAGCV